MTRVVCHQERCVYWDAGVCGADEIILEPEELTCTKVEDIKGLLMEPEELENWDESEDDDDDDWRDEDEDEELFGNSDDDWEPY